VEAGRLRSQGDRPLPGLEIEVRALPIAQTRALRHEILRPHEPIERLTEDEVAEAFAVGAFLDGQLLAVGFIAPASPPAGDGEPGAWRVRGMATAPHARSRGLGAAVLEALVAHARAAGARRVWCNARTPARAFYERAGFSATSDEFEIAGIGPHFVMELPV
jgi:GNAT superfamily N-acetyltransferase